MTDDELAGLSDEERAARADAGEASLVERGLLMEDGDRLRPTEELHAIIAVREAPLLVAFADIV